MSWPSISWYARYASRRLAVVVAAVVVCLNLALVLALVIFGTAQMWLAWRVSP